jgi:hypothetical protein
LISIKIGDDIEENGHFSVILNCVTAHYLSGLQIPSYCQLAQQALLYNLVPEFLNVQDGGAATDSPRHIPRPNLTKKRLAGFHVESDTNGGRRTGSFGNFLNTKQHVST